MGKPVNKITLTKYKKKKNLINITDILINILPSQ